MPQKSRGHHLPCPWSSLSPHPKLDTYIIQWFCYLGILHLLLTILSLGCKVFISANPRMQWYCRLVMKNWSGFISLQLDSLIWETASPRTHKPKIVNESLIIYTSFWDLCFGSRLIVERTHCSLKFLLYFKNVSGLFVDRQLRPKWYIS